MFIVSGNTKFAMYVGYVQILKLCKTYCLYVSAYQIFGRGEDLRLCIADELNKDKNQRELTYKKFCVEIQLQPLITVVTLYSLCAATSNKICNATGLNGVTNREMFRIRR
jgi:hypothetical protein